MKWRNDVQLVVAQILQRNGTRFYQRRASSRLMVYVDLHKTLEELITPVQLIHIPIIHIKLIHIVGIHLYDSFLDLSKELSKEESNEESEASEEKS